MAPGIRRPPSKGSKHSGGSTSWPRCGPAAPAPVTEKAKAHAEKEVKLGAWPGFRLPDLDDMASWLRPQPAVERMLEAVYYDAPDLRLIRAGATLRHRTGEGGPNGLWTAKVP